MPPQFAPVHVHPGQIERAHSGSVVQYGAGLPQPRMLAAHRGRIAPGDIRFAGGEGIQAVNEKPEPDSGEYATVIPVSLATMARENPELDEEFDLRNLGIDLQTEEPLLPNVYHVGSDSPMVNLGQFPAPRSYPTTTEGTDASSKLMYFSDEALFFIFYLHAKDRLQESAHRELTRRRYTWDATNKVWSKNKEMFFDVDRWCFVPAHEYRKLIPQI